MKVRLNGNEHQVEAGTSIPDVLGILGFDSARGVAVAVDGEVVPRSGWEKFSLSEGMRVEVLRAVQGG